MSLIEQLKYIFVGSVAAAVTAAFGGADGPKRETHLPGGYFR